MSTKNYNYNPCQNCGLKGHHVRNCPNPITSLGVISSSSFNILM